jgi:NAD(P)-dependent dehydrogenase (short-subunit alcohol dehydrogenase family)
MDILVNNLGIFSIKSFTEIEDAKWQRFFDTNVISGVRLMRHYLPGMFARDWGRVVFVSSESSVEMPHYGFTKTVQLTISRGVADTTADTGVTCNAVLPRLSRLQVSANSLRRWRKNKARISGKSSRFFLIPRTRPRYSSASPSLARSPT